MSSKFERGFSGLYFAILILAFAFAGLSRPANVWAQTTISTGSIEGTVTDPSGAVVPNAAVTITNQATGQVTHGTTTGSGTYTSGALLPGSYTVSVSSKGFKTIQIPVTVEVGVTTTGNVTLQVGEASTTVEVQAGAVQLNTVQATVQGSVTRQEIENLPVNGRNFLDLASLQPGVQIQDGGTFDPTKNGFSSVSFDSRFGRTARIEVDGVDISDETVGTTTQNIPLSSIQEFQVESSSLDMSTELTSSGAVNITTRSGTNQLHGGAFFAGRWHNTDARFAPQDLFMRRAQWGVNVGGPIKKDKVFFFLDWERTRQDLVTPVEFSAPFSALSGGFNGPFREQELMGRLDWNVSSNWRSFFRYSFDQNSNVAAFAPFGPGYSPFGNIDHAPVYAAGLDGTTGRFTHSFRFGYVHFNNAIADAVSGTNITNPAPGAELFVGNFQSGPNLLAPQATLQHDLQVKYDGSWIHGNHLLRYGVGLNDIQGGGFAKFFGIAPEIVSSTAPSVEAIANTPCAAGQTTGCGPFPGGDTNPLNYPTQLVVFGNGQGFFTDVPKFGYPAGGQFDTRLEAYFGDTWKVRPNFTMIAGIRYVRDTGRTDSQLGPLPLLNQFEPGLGNGVRQPNMNFAPTLGFAWDPTGSGKTVIRAGAGLYYENVIFNNILFDAPVRLPKGLFFGNAVPCPFQPVITVGSTTIDTTGLCGQPIGNVFQKYAAAQREYQVATAAAGPQSNGTYFGNSLFSDPSATGNGLLGPNYRTPFSWQFNAGFERKLTPNSMLSVDYIRNVSLHFLLGYDINHVGDARYLNKNAAMNAINLTNEGFGCPDGSAGIDCAIAAGATMDDYAFNGLDSENVYLGGEPASIYGLTPDTGAAFAGINPNFGQMNILFPIGRSTYNALDVKFQQNVANPFRGARQMSLLFSYALSRAISPAQDQDFVPAATDYRNINHFTGPNALDRTHQFAASAVMSFAHNIMFSINQHIASPLPGNMRIPATDPNGVGEIFLSDVTGDGTTTDILPGTNIGSFSRSINSLSSLNAAISNFNSNYAGKLTPAGQALVNAGLITQSQLVALGATPQPIGLASKGQVFNDSSFDTDLQLSYGLKVHLGGPVETLTISPTFSVYNLFNVANYGPLTSTLDGSGGAPNGTTQGLRTNLITLGSGVYGFDAPRMLEWGVRFDW